VVGSDASGPATSEPDTSNVRLTLEYDGTDFCGWQLQAEGQRTVQGVVEHAIERVTGSLCRVHGAGRTDAGVHAEGQVASVGLTSRLAPDELRRALNANLPADVAVRWAAVVDDGFHARFSARGKVYRYRVWNGEVRSPLRARWTHAEPRALDLGGMSQAAKELVGRHDFASFQAAGAEVDSTVRTLTRFEISGCPGDEIAFEVAGEGFLRHMVRNLVGTLLEVGRGRRTVSSVAETLAARDRRRAGPTAPACGLTLVRVEY